MAATGSTRAEEHLLNYNAELKRDAERLRAVLHEILGILEHHYGLGPDTGDVTGAGAAPRQYTDVDAAVRRAAQAGLFKPPVTPGW